MDGYYKPKLNGEVKELRILELEDIDYMSDDGDLIEEPKSKRARGIFHNCPRCKAITRLMTNYPYCPECNWDSITVLSMEINKCAA